MDRFKPIWYLSPMRAAKVQASLRIRAVSPKPSLLAHTSSESRGTFRQKARSLAPLNGWACAVKICNDGMLEDKNSLDGAHILSWTSIEIDSQTGGPDLIYSAQSLPKFSQKSKTAVRLAYKYSSSRSSSWFQKTNCRIRYLLLHQPGKTITEKNDSPVILGILGQLKWESLKERRKDNRLILLYKGLKGKASIPTDDLIPQTRCCRNQHSMAFQTPIVNTDVYKGSFFPQTIRDWNALPDSLISSAEDAEDCVAKFTSLVRARD